MRYVPGALYPQGVRGVADKDKDTNNSTLAAAFQVRKDYEYE